MGLARKTVVSNKNCPKISGSKCEWALFANFKENDGLATLGLLQDCLKGENISSCYLNFEMVEWADPQPLLILGLILAESKLKKHKIIIDLGTATKESKNINHKIFLKFFAQQGFIRVYGTFAKFKLNNKNESDVMYLEKKLSREPQNTHFLNADCILARIVPANQFIETPSNLSGYVERLITEAQDRAIDTAFGSEPMARDMLFQKLRKLLYELLLNIAEHSHPKGDLAYAGIFARIRGPKPPNQNEAGTWDNLLKRTIDNYGQSKFKPYPYSEWLELFVCDIGTGLTAHISEWRRPGTVVANSEIEDAIRSDNPLESIVFKLFKDGLSRHIRHNNNRTIVTGLRHIGQLLSLGGDYIRIYSQNGSWIGHHFPWDVEPTYSRKDIRNSKAEPKYANLKPVSGTAYSISIQPSHSNFNLSNSLWSLPNEAERGYIIDALKQNTIFNPTCNTEFYDHRVKEKTSPPETHEGSGYIPEVIILRPPRMINKQDLSKWLKFVAGDSTILPERDVEKFVVADLTPFQTLSLRELLLSVDCSAKTSLDIYLVSEHWATICLTSPIGSKDFISSVVSAKNFQSSTQSSIAFNLADLAILLRQMDSEAFWSADGEKYQTPFFKGTVEWTSSTPGQKTITLNRFIDFSQALADPPRYRACRRALRRCLELFPEHVPIGADTLVASLVKDVAVRSYSKIDYPTSNVIVGSVKVTANTVKSIMAANNEAFLHIMTHEGAINVDGQNDLNALLWIPEHPDAINTSVIKTPSWRRIPNTPYIAPLGEQSISLLRYRRNEDGSLDFSKPIYERTPEDTYLDFERLKVLKSGHWKYGSRHDLLTINMRLALRYSFLDRGELFSWIKDKFTLYFGDGSTCKSQLLIYPSHSVTDNLFNQIRQDEEFDGILPECGMIPVKFLGTYTVSPLLQSYLVKYQIEEQIRQKGLDTWSAVVFDDGTVSGKHIRELTQFIQGLGADPVYSLVILDRTGLPVQEAVTASFLEDNKRYWRWDVPPLGNKHDCPLCQSLSIVEAMTDEFHSGRQQKRIEEWKEEWRVRDIDSEWHKKGLTPQKLNPPIKITFGVDECDKKRRREKRINIYSSTQASSLLLELTRLTTRSDAALKKSILIKERSRDTSLEIVASQLMLFYDELSTKEKIERYTFLIETLWSEDETSQAMGLAGLCFALAEKEVLITLLSATVFSMLSKYKLKNLDAIITVNIIIKKTAVNYFNSSISTSKLSSIEYINYILLGGGRTLKKSVGEFLTALYRNPKKTGQLNHHTTELRKNLSNLAQTKVEAEDDYISLLTSKVIEDLRVTEHVLKNLLNELHFHNLGIDIVDLSKLIKNMESLYSSKNSNKNEEIIGEANKISTTLFDTDSGIVPNIGGSLFKNYKNAEDLDSTLIRTITENINDRWEEKVASKYEKSRWKTQKNNVVLPDIKFSGDSTANNIWIYVDSFVLSAIEDAMSNVYHADIKIEDPFLPDEFFIQTADLWIRVGTDKGQKHINLELVNSSKSADINPKQTINIAGLERIGGRIKTHTREVKDKLQAITIIQIPLHSYFIEESV